MEEVWLAVGHGADLRNSARLTRYTPAYCKQRLQIPLLLLKLESTQMLQG